MAVIRVLQVLGRLDRGGAETMIMNLYRHINRELVQFDFVIHTEEQCDYNEEVKKLGGNIYSVPAFGRTTMFQYRKAWEVLFLEHPEYRILHSHVRSTASLYLGIAKKYGLKTIVHAHNTSSGNGLAALVKGTLQYPLRFQADYLFACSEKAGQWLFGKRACLKSHFIFVKNAIDLEQFRTSEVIRNRVRMEQNAEHHVVIGHVGRFEEQKNHRFLIEIFEEVHRLEPEAVLWLIGSGVLEEEMKRLVWEKKIENFVRFLGNRKDVNELMQGMDFFLFPSKFEGLPVTLIEAQAVGLPILASEQITEEVCVTDLIQRLSLECGKNVWAETLQNARSKQGNGKNEKEEIHFRELKTAGYSILDTSQWLMEFYVGLQGEV